jgi:ribosomal protein S18 acetylase RimI-like enzyme
MKIRRMLSKDINEVYNLGVNVNEFSVSLSTNFWSKKELVNWLNNKNDILLIAEDKGYVIGFLFCKFHRQTGNAIIDNVLVKEQYRNKGIGTKLMKTCLKELKSKSCTYVYTLVKPDRKESINFFKKVGFKEGFKFLWVEKKL